jgi:hypothetical protein
MNVQANWLVLTKTNTGKRVFVNLAMATTIEVTEGSNTRIHFDKGHSFCVYEKPKELLVGLGDDSAAGARPLR